MLIYIYISVREPFSAAHTDTFQFIQRLIFEQNTCTVNKLSPFNG